MAHTHPHTYMCTYPGVHLVIVVTVRFHFLQGLLSHFLSKDYVQVVGLPEPAVGSFGFSCGLRYLAIWLSFGVGS